MKYVKSKYISAETKKLDIIFYVQAYQESTNSIIIKYKIYTNFSPVCGEDFLDESVLALFIDDDLTVVDDDLAADDGDLPDLLDLVLDGTAADLRGGDERDFLF